MTPLFVFYIRVPRWASWLWRRLRWRRYMIWAIRWLRVWARRRFKLGEPVQHESLLMYQRHSSASDQPLLMASSSALFPSPFLSSPLASSPLLDLLLPPGTSSPSIKPQERSASWAAPSPEPETTMPWELRYLQPACHFDGTAVSCGVFLLKILK